MEAITTGKNIFESFFEGIYYIRNFKKFDSNIHLLVCFHGNSSTSLTFVKILEGLIGKVQCIAVDLPGCGKSKWLENYTMSIVGQIMTNLINSFQSPKVYLFGHSLGGHLLAFIDVKISGIAVAGTPFLSSANDFPFAFKPDQEVLELIPFLSKETAFTLDEARKFVSHTGVTGETLEIMISSAIQTDGKFRKGCLSTLTSVNQKEQIESMKNVVIFHAENDGVINPEYLETIKKDCLFEQKIHYLPGKHMTPILQSDKIIEVITKAFFY